MAQTKTWLIDTVRELTTIDPCILDIKEAINHANGKNKEIWVIHDYKVNKDTTIIYEWVIVNKKFKYRYVRRVTKVKDCRSWIGYDAITENMHYVKF